MRRLLTDVRPRDLVIGIDPATVDINPTEAASLQGARFVNVAGVPKVDWPEGAAPYLHAKMLGMVGVDGELLVTGSANPSVAAFSRRLPHETRRPSSRTDDPEPGLR